MHDRAKLTVDAPAPASIWQVQLLGGLRATHGNLVLAQFPSRPVATLLACLAINPQRRRSREELIELLWPGLDVATGRNRLRQVLSTLKRMLEPPDVVPDSVLLADRQSVGTHADALRCDVHEFERFVRERNSAQAAHVYRGDLLPGFFDEWIEDERARLRAVYERIQADVAAGAAHGGVDHPRVDEAARGTAAGSDGPFRSLPTYVSAFFGREREMTLVQEALATARLVTLSGFGGCGKTRLAIEVARTASGIDTIAFVPLAECTDATQIVERIRAALQMDTTQDNALAQLCAFLVDREVLLVLDNFEQLVERDGSTRVVELLERLPRLHCLVTSRRALDVAGEREIALDPLTLPQPAMSVAEAAGTPSVALFVDRARGARPDFALTERNRAPLIRLAAALEGLPLAIEIAASRIRAFSPEEMCDALAQRFVLLSRRGQRGARLGRHASLHATVEWSWHLLEPSRQRFFAALSVFRGGWTAMAVAAICQTPDAAHQLEELVADSLLRVDRDYDGATRFSMLETIREFAAERVGEDAAGLRSRHRGHYLDVARQATVNASALPDEDFPNLLQAITTALDDGVPAVALAIGVALRSHWEARGTTPLVLRLLERALADCPPKDPILHPALDLLALMALNAGDAVRGIAYATRAVEIADVPPVDHAASLVTLARLTWEREQSGADAMPLLEKALAIATEAAAPRVQADALRVMATVVLRHGSHHADYAQADGLFARAEALYREARLSVWTHRTLLSRVGCLTGLERYAEARQMLEVCERFFAAMDSVADLITVANMSGYVESGQEHWAEAVAAGRRCVQLAWDRHAHLWLATALGNLPHPLAMLGHASEAAQLMAFSARFWEGSIGPLSASDTSTIEDVRTLVTAALGEVQTASLWMTGAELSLPDAVHLALSVGA